MTCGSLDAAASPPSNLNARQLAQFLQGYRTPNDVRRIAELAITFLPLVALWAAAWFAFSSGIWWLSLLLSVSAAGFLVRLFMIQHDCGHGAFFSQRRANDWVGRVIGVLTLTPYDHWRRAHAVHHASCGNLDQRGIGDIDTLTVREYMARTRWAGSDTGSIATRSSCSASARPTYFCWRNDSRSA
jgi:acyl-lipid omega-6 desaturase (Delta-12 desaturase)